MKKEATVYHNPRYYAFGSLQERVNQDDARLWEGKPSYQELMGKQIEENNKKQKGAR